MSDTAAQIEGLLFALGRPLSRTELAKQLGLDAGEIARGIEELRGQTGRGVMVVDDDKQVELRISPLAAPAVEHARKEEYAREIGRAGQEALAAVLYRGPLTRAEVDFIRGVNSSQTLRTLAVRGLLRKIPNPKDERSFLYEPTTELLATLGVSAADDLPEYVAVRDKLKALEDAYREKQSEEHA
jgi:segregation and condensation protein B